MLPFVVPAIWRTGDVPQRHRVCGPVIVDLRIDLCGEQSFVPGHWGGSFWRTLTLEKVATLTNEEIHRVVASLRPLLFVMRRFAQRRVELGLGAMQCTPFGIRIEIKFGRSETLFVRELEYAIRSRRHVGRPQPLEVSRIRVDREGAK